MDLKLDEPFGSNCSPAGSFGRINTGAMSDLYNRTKCTLSKFADVKNLWGVSISDGYTIKRDIKRLKK